MGLLKKLTLIFVGIVIGVSISLLVILVKNTGLKLPSDVAIAQKEDVDFILINENSEDIKYSFSALYADENYYIPLGKVSQMFQTGYKIEESNIIKVKNPKDGLIKAIKVEGDSLYIDGSPVSMPPETVLYNIDGNSFVSTEFIKEYFGVENQYGVVAHGYPIESYIISTDKIIYFNDFENTFYKVNGKEYQGDLLENVKIELDGATLLYGEPGLIEYVITKSTYMTERGITIGSTRKEVQEKYGKLGSDNDNVWRTFLGNAEYSEGNKLVFTFENDIVVNIKYGW